MNKLTLLLSLFLQFTVPQHSGKLAVASNVQTINASSCSQSAVQTALSSATASTVVINIPAGNCTWTSNLSYTVPGINDLTIQGATHLTWTGTPGSSSWTPLPLPSTGSQTILTDNVSSNDYFWQIITGSSSTKVTIKGITWMSQSTAGTKYNGYFHITGASQNVRLSGNYFTDSTTLRGQDEWVQVDDQFGGMPTGVADHNYFFHRNGNTDGGNDIRVFGAQDDNIGFGDGAWFNGPKFGTSTPFYMENNYFYGGASDDCVRGGRFVTRYNTFDSLYVAVQTHGTKSPGGPDRACNSYEAYKNYFTGPTSTPADSVVGAKGGTALIWGNSMPNGAYRFYAGSTDRAGGDSTDETNPPGGWGYCGTSTPIPSTYPTNTPNGVGACWDGNTGGSGTCSGATTPNPSSSGYPCLDALGRGQDTQALNGQAFPNRKNSVTGTIAWPHQYLWPIYLFNNTINPQAGVAADLRGLAVQGNRDFYGDCNNLPVQWNGGSDTCSSFTGAKGTGSGLLSARPSTCTAGMGGTYGASPTGSYGVAYWATDANSGNGELYICTSTNTWTPVYQPYTYPHPLNH